MKVRIASLLAICVAAIAAAPASAQTPEEVPLSELMATGTVLDGERITEITADGYVTENVTVGVDAKSTATVFCGTRRERVTYRSFIWTMQWWYQQTQGRCYNSVTKKLGQVYGWNRDWAVTGAPWEFVGSYARETWGAGYTWHFASKIRGHFRLCYGPLGCVEHRYPSIKQDFYGNGAYTHKKLLG